MTEVVARGPAPRTDGKVFRWALAYDLLLRVYWGGAEQTYREKVLELAGLRPGDAVLDVGCGTGTLAISAKRHVGPIGKVVGIDASVEMIARARRKAAKASTDVEFRVAAAEAMPFADAMFDAVLSTTVLHCLPDVTRRRCVGEMRRILRPGGRLLVVDFGGAAEERKSLMAHLRHHRNFDLRDTIPLLREVGLTPLQSGEIGVSDLRFALALAPSTAGDT